MPKTGTEDPWGEASVSDSAFPNEPFACPACGQMLAPSCHVCVACKQPINFTKIKRATVTEGTLKPQASRPTTERARFPWRLFLILLVARLLAAVAAQHRLGLVKAELLLGSVEILSAAWVFYDAHEKGVAKPLRWALGSLLLWIVVFPWYLARRKNPQTPCPFVEAEVGPLTRALLFALLVFFLLSVVLVILKRPPR